jgi:hypothetical protein
VIGARPQHPEPGSLGVARGEIAPPALLTATAVVTIGALAVVGGWVGTSDPAWLLLLLLAAVPFVGLLTVWDRSWRIAGRPGRRSSTMLRLALVLLLLLGPGVARVWSPSTEAAAPFLALAGFVAAFDWSFRRDLRAVLHPRR